jgi:uracil-DNA glycosylase
MDKTDALKQLALIRKADRLDGHQCFGDFHGGSYDELDFVVPWTISAQNVDADVLIMGQDWNSADNLAGQFNEDQQRFGQQPKLASNRNLQRLLKEFLGLNFSDTYATDLFTFAKPGGMSGPIPRSDLIYCARKYAIPQVEIVKPKIVISLGVTTYNAIRWGLGHSGWFSLTQASSHTLKIGDADVLAVTHTGGRAFNQAQSLGIVEDQWRRIADRLSRHRAASEPKPLSE